jgi:hypothetical protein
MFEILPVRNLTGLSRGSFRRDYKEEEAVEYFSIYIFTVTP